MARKLTPQEERRRATGADVVSSKRGNAIGNPYGGNLGLSGVSEEDFDREFNVAADRREFQAQEGRVFDDQGRGFSKEGSRQQRLIEERNATGFVGLGGAPSFSLPGTRGPLNQIGRAHV